MPYIGHSPEVAQRRYESIDDISGSFNGSTTSFALQVGGVTPAPFPVASENVLISVGGVIQEPDGTGSNGFQLTGTNIVFSSAPAAGQSFFGVILAGADYVTAGHAFPDGDAAGPSITFSQDLDTGVFRAGSGAIGFGGNGSEHARIDGSGRLLVGTTTARATGDVTAPLQVEGTGFNTSSLNLISNAGANTGNVSHISLAKSRGTSDGSSTVVASGDSLGTIQWCGADGTDLNSVAASINGAVDNTPGSNDMPGRLTFATTGDGNASPTERVRIDSVGRLLVGTTSAREHLNDGSDSTQISLEGTTQNTTTLSVVRNSNNDGPAHLVLGKSRGGSANSTTVLQSGDTIGHINFEGADGSHLIRAGQISCVVDAAPGANDMPGRLSFSVTSDGSNNLTERLRINRKGFLKAGPRITDGSHGVADLNSSRHEFTSDDNGWTIIVTHTSGSASEHEGILIDYANSPNGTNNSFIQGNDSGGLRFRFASNGGLYNYQGNNSNLSDQREKKNIVSLESKWDKVKSWDLKKFHYNEDADEDDLRYGVIAQQVEEHCPEVLTDWIKQPAEDAVLDEDGNVVTPAVAEVTRKGVKEQQMMWMAIKALQEAQTRIESLETQNTAQQTTIDDLLARVTTLEAA